MTLAHTIRLRLAELHLFWRCVPQWQASFLRGGLLQLNPCKRCALSSRRGCRHDDISKRIPLCSPAVAPITRLYSHCDLYACVGYRRGRSCLRGYSWRLVGTFAVSRL